MQVSAPTMKHSLMNPLSRYGKHFDKKHFELCSIVMEYADQGDLF